MARPNYDTTRIGEAEKKGKTGTTRGKQVPGRVSCKKNSS